MTPIPGAPQRYRTGIDWIRSVSHLRRKSNSNQSCTEKPHGEDSQCDPHPKRSGEDEGSGLHRQQEAEQDSEAVQNIHFGPTFEPVACGEGARIVYPDNWVPPSKRAPNPPTVELIEERDPVTGRTRTVEKITHRNTYWGFRDNPQAFGRNATVRVGKEPYFMGLIKHLDPKVQDSRLNC
ncbi:hypothetical protein MD484_g4049, partial [Candolleomyces efflorescens]